MVESPTYYHSLSPVLRSLKEFDMENFPLQEEVVYAKPTELPDYLKEATFQTAIVCSSKKKTTAVQVKEEKPEAPEENYSSEPSEASDEYSSNTSEASEEEDLGMKNLKPDEDWSDEDWSDEESDMPETNITLSRRRPNSDSSSEFMHSRTTTNSSREGGYKECKSIDQYLFLDFQCEIDQSEIVGVDLEEKEKRHMDFTDLESKEMKHSLDIKESRINALSSNCSKASTLTEPQDIPSQGKLGGRMNVEHFLETFSSSSESSLEASQCDALVHALKNKLAIVQG